MANYTAEGFSSFAADRRRDLARLDEDAADLDFLQSNLEKTNMITTKMAGMLSSFDDRLGKLEKSIIPIHKSTQKLTLLAENIDKTLLAVDNLVGYFDLASREERFITKGPNENNILPYLQSMGRIREALEVLEATRLRACDKVIAQMKQLLKAAMLHLETLFRKWLSAASEPIDPRQYLERDLPTMAAPSITSLSELSKYISSSESEVGYTVDFTKPYIEIRSNFLQRSLQPMALQSTLTERRRDRDKPGFVRYSEALVKMFRDEAALVVKLMPSQNVPASLRGAIQPALNTYLETGRSLNTAIKRNMLNDIFILFEVIASFDRPFRSSLADVLKLTSKGNDDTNEMINSFAATAAKSFAEFLEECRGRKEKDPSQGMSGDGTVHELTSNCINYLKRLLDYRETVEVLLIQLGDGNWNSGGIGTSLTGADGGVLPSSKVSGSTILKHYFTDALETLSTTLLFKAKSYKKPVLTTIFLLNNFHFIHRALRSPPLVTVFDDGRGPEKFRGLVKRQMDLYQDSWKPCYENLMDVTQIRGGSIKTNLGGGERQGIKDKFRNFNTEFEELYRSQKSYAIPDPELRTQVLQDIKQVLLPMYSRFVDKYQTTEFSKNPSKYIKYSSDQLDKMVGQFFEPSA